MSYRFNELMSVKRELGEVIYRLSLISQFNYSHKTNYAALTKAQSGIDEHLQWTTLQAAKSHLQASERRLTNSLKFNRFNRLVSPIFKGDK